ncbi:hypothetical protein RJ639_046933 [Escallonia herrerae]|uniref:histidine kinase n=1 Tax=Escallonia herrerae TaxID=1293975 RepID=A0AA88W6B1_9ASTE|nr:hypothetical protein RJ639_046933 [Escallonia herrerae]
MKLGSLVVRRPVCFFFVLAFIVLLFPSLMIPFWMIKVQKIEDEVKLISHNIHQEILSEIGNTAYLLHPMTSSATNLARVLTSSLDETELCFFVIKAKVAPMLFHAISTVPHLSQITFIGLDGLFFSYYNQGNDEQPLAVYSNSSFSATSNLTTKYTWYSQPVNRDTGKLYGEAVKSAPLFIVNSSWFQQALNNAKGSASLRSAWTNPQDLLFLNTAGVDRMGGISLGFEVKPLMNIFSGINGNGASLYLATKDGITLISEGIPDTHIVLTGNSVSFQLLKPSGGDQIGLVGNVTCLPNNGASKGTILSIWGTKYVVYCSPLVIVGVESVYVLAVPHKGLESLIHKNIKLAFVLLIVMIAAVVISIFAFMFSTVRAARREMHLCAALIKQMEVSQQAERKSMNKSIAFASASHDVRASLAGLTGLIEMCHDEMQLVEEVFDLAQLLEDVTDLFYPVAMKKGVDVLLDLHDGSVNKICRVKGDPGKLKQILCNLLSNAVKFTSEGHVTVRAWVKKPSLESSIFASARNNSLKCLSCLFFKDDEAYSDLEAMKSKVQKDPNHVEFLFEVNDTGKGIPKEKQESVFENYVQVKETALGYEGTGLGLGIVQSLVRLMGGEITIVDKEVGKNGTCFRFNAFLTICRENENGREEDIEAHGGYISSDSHQHSGPSARIHSPKQEGSHVVLFIQSDERRKIAQNFMERLEIKVSVVKKWEQLASTLKKIKEKVIISRYSSSGRSDTNSRSDFVSRTASSNSSTRSKDVPLSALDGTDEVPLPIQRRAHNAKSNAPDFVLIVIDTNGGPFRELSRAVAEFRRDLNSNTRTTVVWTDKPGSRNIHSHGLDEDKLSPTDLIITKPFHGSRLYEVIGLLPEFGGMPTPYQAGQLHSDSGTSGCKPCKKKSTSSSEKPLREKRVLVADDSSVFSRVAATQLSKFGARVDVCRNGEEALELVNKAFADRKKFGSSSILPYDYILMDCEVESLTLIRLILKFEYGYLDLYQLVEVVKPKTT